MFLKTITKHTVVFIYIYIIGKNFKACLKNIFIMRIIFKRCFIRIVLKIISQWTRNIHQNLCKIFVMKKENEWKWLLLLLLLFNFGRAMTVIVSQEARVWIWTYVRQAILNKTTTSRWWSWKWSCLLLFKFGLIQNP